MTADDGQRPAGHIHDALAAFDATSDAMFALACRLTEGDVDAAVEVVASAFVSLSSAPSAAAHGTAVRLHADPGSTALVAAVCRSALGSPTRLPRVTVELHVVRDWSVETIARVAARSEEDVRAALTTGLLAVDSAAAAPDPERVDERLRRDERWLDDVSRARCRGAIRTGRRPPPRTTSTSVTSPFAARSPAMHRDHRVWVDTGQEFEPPGPPPRAQRRGVTAVAVAAVGTVVVLAVAAVSALVGTDGAREAATAPVATALDADVLGTEPEPTSPSVVSSGYVIDPAPDGFRPAGAFARAAPTTNGWFQLWAEPGATRGSGRWIAITTIDSDVSGRFTLDRARATDISGNPALQAVSADGVPQLAVQLVGGGRFSITGHGRSTDDLREIAEAMVVDDGRFSFAAAAALIDEGLDLLVSTASPFGNLDAQVHAGSAQTSTYQSDDLSRRMLLSVRPSSPNDLTVATFLLPNGGEAAGDPPAARTTLAGARVVTVSAETAYDGKTTTTLQWHDGPNTVTLSGTADLDLLLDAVGRVRPATTDEWTALQELPPTYYPI